MWPPFFVRGEMKAKQRLTLDLNREMHRELKVAAALEGITMRELVAQILARDLSSRDDFR
jgi:predicted HicB family RNase H-like nuclease